jgi:hypothetical protein
MINQVLKEITQWAKETAGHYLQKAFDGGSVSEKLLITEAAIYYDLPVADEMLEDINRIQERNLTKIN